MELQEKVLNALNASVEEAVTTTFSAEHKIVDGDLKDISTTSVICSIGFGGSIDGSVSICLSDDGACRLVSKMIGMDIEEMCPDVLDGSGEALNIIVGGLKRRLAEQGHSFEIGVPTVIQGQKMHVTKPGELMVIRKCLVFEQFEFGITVFFKEHESGEDKKQVTEKAQSNAGDMLSNLIQDENAG
ncbi:MAG: chemotaxis protein CheX [Candidatus Omnitrophica bacterium]|nr:chemotaxis protein CheX [Candidatus Omnitrophota bacterium]